MSTTETASGRYAGIEDWSTQELVDAMLESQMAAIAAVHGARAPLSQAIDQAAERLKRGGRMIYAGAGTSGRIAAQDAAELPPTFNWPYERAIPVMAGGDRAFIHAAEGAEDDGNAARTALAELGLSDKDVVIGVAASGRTPFAVEALRYARETGALAIGLYNNAGGRIGEVSDIAILIETGAELLAGSTRMKAGTAQKVALNAISTGVMTKLGFVYRGLMVEMRATNEKLVGRAIKMVATLCAVSEDTAREAFFASGESIKVATVMLTLGLDKAGAESRIAATGGTLRAALED